MKITDKDIDALQSWKKYKECKKYLDDFNRMLGVVKAYPAKPLFQPAPELQYENGK